MKTAASLLLTTSFLAASLEAGTIAGHITYDGTQMGKVFVRASQILPNNKVLALDGDGDYGTTTITDLSGSELTIQFWFKGTSVQSAVRQQSAGWVIAGWNGTHILSHDGGVGGIAAGANLTDGNWHHVAVTWKQASVGGFASYLDGRLVEQRDSAADPIPNHNAKVFFGAINGEGEFANGLLDEISIWHRALTATEIAAGMKQSLNGGEDGLTGYWNFNDGTGKDLSPNGYDAELKNGAVTVAAENPARAGGRYQNAYTEPRPYGMGDLPPATNYRVTAFVDLDGNGLWSSGEPQTAYVGNPFDLTADKTGVDLDLGGVVTPPTLTVSRSAGSITISWPVTVTGFTLESSGAVVSGTWAPVPGVENNSVTLPTTEALRFFRLKK